MQRSEPHASGSHPQERGSWRVASVSAGALLRRGLEIAGSLKLTCLLFLMSMFLVFVGSLAQSRRDVWQVVNQYFRVYVADVRIGDFFPPSMFPQLIDVDWDTELGGFAGFPFPGGWTIGWLLLANLLAAHFTRIRVQARGGRLQAGIGSLLTGLILLYFIVASGNQQTGVEQGSSRLSPGQIWNLLLTVMFVTVAVLSAAVVTGGTQSRSEKSLLIGVAGTLAALLVYFMFSGPVDLSSMRILWQLLKACACAGLLLAGTVLLFRRRGGVVLLHLGICILMVSELVVGLYGHESLMRIAEGETVEFARDVRELELAIASTGDGRTAVVAIPESLLLESAGGDDEASMISLADTAVPFDLMVTRFYRHCRLRSAEPDDALTRSGLGSFAVPVEQDPVDGMSGESNVSAALIRLIHRETGEALQTVLLSLSLSEFRNLMLPERVEVNESSWDLSLRFRRNYRPYSVELLDVSRETYVGSSTPRSFQSTIRIRDSRTREAKTFTLWMNNPLRYEGETFYQSGYHLMPSGEEQTTLQLVQNSGWMLPYIGCVVAAFGMFAHFGIALRRYLRRRSQQDSRSVPRGRRSPQPATVIPVVTALVCLAYLSFDWIRSDVSATAPAGMNTGSFAELPMAGNGRPQPLDSWARSQLLLASHRSTFSGELSAKELDSVRAQLHRAIGNTWPDVNTESLKQFHGEYEDWIEETVRLTGETTEFVEAHLRPVMTRRMSAVRWFLDMIARPDRAVRHRFIRIDNDQILALLGLEKRTGLLYSPQEVERRLDSLDPIDRSARGLRQMGEDSRLSVLQRQVTGLFDTIRRLDTMQQVFQPAVEDHLLATLVETWRILGRLKESPVPMGIVTGIDEEQQAWETVLTGSLMMSCRRQMAELGVTSRDELRRWCEDQLPAVILLDALETSWRILEDAAASQHSQNSTDPDSVRKLAASMVERTPDLFDREVFSLIASSDPELSPQQIVDSLDDGRIQELTSDRVTRELSVVYRELENRSADPRLKAIQLRFRGQADSSDAVSDAQFRRQFNQEMLTVLLDDLSARHGTVIFPGGKAEAFEASATGMVRAFTAWSEGDAAAFNQSVSDYSAFLASNSVPHTNGSLIQLEARFNRFDPFGKAIRLYSVGLGLTLLGWIIWRRLLTNTAFAVVVTGFVLHSVALWLRIEISGRPPVTSLYSSAVFIGWAVVGASAVIERMTRLGIGNAVAASCGAAALMIAHYLARDEGDTFSVMQAVLDTTFWLATHVVCITLGYSATFLAGFLGVCLVIVMHRDQWHTTREKRDPTTDSRDQLARVIYGVLCFAVLFSLIGTVLGGLWADDSWGRFWGWDPKENGALMIVLWNALILHARWGRMTGSYGMAVMAIGGNIVTSWSWFGVNELQAGLHTYGFTEGRMGVLAGFILSQLLIIAVAVCFRPTRQHQPAH